MYSVNEKIILQIDNLPRMSSVEVKQHCEETLFFQVARINMKWTSVNQ